MLIIFLTFFFILWSEAFTGSSCGCFSNVDGGTNIRRCGDNCGGSCTQVVQSQCIVETSSLSQVRWGVCFDAACDADVTSGLGFTGVSPLSFDVGDEFLVGQLHHFNHAVQQNTFASAATLRIRLTVDGGLEQAFSFVLNVHETKNEAGTCQYNATGAGVPCADRISYNLNGLDQQRSFMLNGDPVTLSLSGFKRANDSSAPSTAEFISDESSDNVAFLFAKVVGACPTQACPYPQQPQLDGTKCVCGCSAALCREPPFDAQFYFADPVDPCVCRCNQVCPSGENGIGFTCDCPTPSPTPPMTETTTTAMSPTSATPDDAGPATNEVTDSFSVALGTDGEGGPSALLPLFIAVPVLVVALLVGLAAFLLVGRRRRRTGKPFVPGRAKRKSRTVGINDNPLYETANLSKTNPLFSEPSSSSKSASSSRRSRKNSRSAMHHSHRSRSVTLNTDA